MNKEAFLDASSAYIMEAACTVATNQVLMPKRTIVIKDRERNHRDITDVK